MSEGQILKLTIKEEKFCLEYVKGGNGSKAASLAGYAPKTARITASKLLTKPNIIERIQELKENIAETLELNAVMIAAEFKKLAFSNVTDTRSSWMTLKDFKKLSEDVKASIAEVHYETKRVGNKNVKYVKIKMHNKIDALQALTEMLGYNAPKKIDHTNNGGSFDKVPTINIICDNVTNTPH